MSEKKQANFFSWVNLTAKDACSEIPILNKAFETTREICKSVGSAFDKEFDEVVSFYEDKLLQFELKTQ